MEQNNSNIPKKLPPKAAVGAPGHNPPPPPAKPKINPPSAGGGATTHNSSHALEQNAKQQALNEQNQKELLLKQEQEKQKQEQQRKLQEEQKKLEEQKRLKEQKRLEEQKKIEAEKKEQARLKKQQRREKAKKLFKNRVFLVFFCLFIVWFIFFVAIMIPFIVLITKKIPTPTFSIYQLNSGTYICMEQNTYARGYEVMITDPNNKSFTVYSRNNNIEIKSYLKQAGKFEVKVRYLGKTNVANSEYSEGKQLENFVKLSTPEVFVNSNKTISWNPVKNAEYYTLYYMANLTEDKVESVRVENSSDEIIFSTADLDANGLGNYYVCVVACPSEDGYFLESEPSVKQVYTNFAVASKPTSASFNTQTKTLELTLKKDNPCKNFKLEFNYNNFTDVINVSTLGLVGEQALGQSDLVKYYIDLSSFNFYTIKSLNLYALGDGLFTLSSNAFSVSVV